MKERIIAAVVDTALLTLYREDGSTIEIPQGDPRVRGIINTVLPLVQQNLVAEVDLEFLNTYKEFEEKTNGFVKFFRVAKKAVANLFGQEEEAIAPTGEFGTVPLELTNEQVIGDSKISPSMAQAVEEILSQATPVSQEGYKDSDTTSDHTIVAQVGDTLIPGAENLKEQFAYSSKGSTIGMENFMKRIAAVIGKRSHSVEDLLRFMEKGDLPVADDGSIIAYKLLYGRDGHYVDCHTKKVTQKVGSFVCMDESLVDPNRRNECSNGLHIARRGYLGGFSGDVCVLVKIAPEDVIAVPAYDSNKVRVCGYHILFELDSESMSKLKRNLPMTDIPAAAKMLGRAMSGDHIRKIEEVRITQQQGGGIKITPLDENGKLTENIESKPATAFDDPVNVPKPDPVDPVEIAAQASKVTMTGRTALAVGLVEKMNNPNLNSKLRLEAAEELLALKKRTKVSWLNLGIPSVTDSEIRMTISKLGPTEAPAVEAAADREAAKAFEQAANEKAVKDVMAKAKQPLPVVPKASPAKGGTKETEAQPKAPTVPVQQPVKAETTVAPTRAQQARSLFCDNDIAGLKAFKSKAKVSWTSLGFTSKEVDKILKG